LLVPSSSPCTVAAWSRSSESLEPSTGTRPELAEVGGSHPWPSVQTGAILRQTRRRDDRNDKLRRRGA
jgi:hypothetical protein